MLIHSPACAFNIITKMEKKIDIVIPLGIGSKYDDSELKYCLRSIQKHVKNLGNVFIVGHKPKWLCNVIHIPCDDINAKNKDANIIRKVIKACDNPKLKENFIRMSDDQIFLQDVYDIPLLRDGLMFKKIKNILITNRWQKRFKNTCKLFDNAFIFDTHTPQPYKKSEFIELPERYKDIYVDGRGYIINSLYFNHFGYTTDKLSKDYKLDVRSPMSYEEITNGIKSKLYLSYNNSGFNTDLQRYLGKTFSKKSKFEK